MIQFVSYYKNTFPLESVPRGNYSQYFSWDVTTFFGNI